MACLLGATMPLQGAETPGYELDIRPSICVSYDSELPCTMSMEVSWKAPTPSAVCLMEVGEDEPLHCWDAATRGSVELAYASHEDLGYELVMAADGTALASADIKVINRDLRSSRSRRRHVWSIL
ncbi:MAG TPA: DUF3019 domain-containing protein [Hyphomicrobiales bacterium]|nr:DUF3019 domain-containing protein [Hyphomicrobiales bacterium]